METRQIELKLQNEELIEARATAQNSAKNYSELYELAPFGYFTLSPQGQIMSLNRSCAQTLGKDQCELLQCHFVFFVAEDSKTSLNNFLEKLFKEEGQETCEIALLVNEDVQKYVQLSGIVTKNDKKCLINLIDITQQKRAMMAIMESQRLGIIGEMTSSIAHDFNNSLQIISGNLELALLNMELPYDILGYLDNIHTAVHDTSERIKLLQRFNEKKLDHTQYSSVDLRTIIDEVLLQIQPLWKDEVEKNGFSIFITKIYDGQANVFCNASEIRIVLINIFKNCIEAMPFGGRIIIQTENIACNICISITDTGIGMNGETKVRVFQPFYSTKGLEIGRGLGMSSALTIINEHRGNIIVKNSNLGNGTSIEILLPISYRPDPKQIINGIEATDKLPEIKPVRVLWVEDDESICQVVSRILTLSGHIVDTANSGSIALNLLNQKAYDLVVTDIGMPGMNGWQLADILKERYNGKMKIAIASGWGDQISETQKQNHGVQYNINKPFTTSQLKQLLEEVTRTNLE